MNGESYEEVLKRCPFTEVSFGYGTIRLFTLHELPGVQVGYSVDHRGRSLVGEKDGDWLKAWVVVAYDELCGDPIFIDTSAEGFPVYTAAHGEGSWDPTLIGDSLGGFFEALEQVARVSQGRESPVALEGNPLHDEERKQALANIEQANPRSEIWFWELFLESK